MTVPCRLGVIIVNYRTTDILIDCLTSLSVPGALPSGTHVMVVEGGSGDDSAVRIDAAIKENGWSEWAALLPLQRNGGFAYGNNRGLERLRELRGEPEYILFLNPDTVPRKSALPELLAFMESSPKVGIAGSRLEDMDETRQACAFRFPSPAAELESEARMGIVSRLLHRWRIVPDVGDRPVQVDWVSGASMIVRSEVLRQVGSFDEGYFLYYEEVDLCRRAAAAGWSCFHVPASRVVHLVGQATGVTRRDVPLPRRPVYWFESRNRYFKTHHGALYISAADMAWVLGHVAYKAKHLLRRRPSGSPPYLLADFIRHSFKN
ncbi:glycosyltransferase family 2 protein [Corticibacterium sp. UT-5YL-CI-8]|nr:glycosyltransferase family 2 protein [Tianweitania sp. UT-5YL-CI-8]